MNQPDRAPSISLGPRAPALRERYPMASTAPLEARYRCGCCDEWITEERSPGAVWLVVAFCLGFLVLGAYAWADVAVRAVWGLGEMAR